MLAFHTRSAFIAALMAVIGRNLKSSHKDAAKRDIARLRGE